MCDGKQPTNAFESLHRRIGNASNNFLEQVLVLGTFHSSEGDIVTLEDGTGLLQACMSEQLMQTIFQGKCKGYVCLFSSSKPCIWLTSTNECDVKNAFRLIDKTGCR
jgi:hypothetical protein